MKIHCLTSPPAPELAQALAEFEKEFQYPLGLDETFTISHVDDYALFFRSLGEARIYLAEREGEIVGALTLVGREIQFSDGEIMRAAYFCDAKVVSAMRGSFVLGRLAMAAHVGAREMGFGAAFSVVMGGSMTSDQYTGRLGIPGFTELGKLAIIRFDTAAPFDGLHGDFSNQKCHRPIAALTSLVSKIKPQKIGTTGANGILSDTLRAKRLWKDDGTEIRSAHLVDIEFDSIEAFSKLIGLALQKAAELDFPNLFLALPKSALCEIPNSAILAEAGLFGTGLPVGEWIVNTSEI